MYTGVRVEDLFLNVTESSSFTIAPSSRCAVTSCSLVDLDFDNQYLPFAPSRHFSSWITEREVFTCNQPTLTLLSEQQPRPAPDVTSLSNLSQSRTIIHLSIRPQVTHAITKSYLAVHSPLTQRQTRIPRFLFDLLKTSFQRKRSLVDSLDSISNSLLELGEQRFLAKRSLHPTEQSKKSLADL